VIAQTADQVPGVLRAVLSIVARDNPNELRIQSPLNLAAIQEEILGDMDRDGHASVLINVMSGGGLVALVVFSDVLIRRRDLGRRRALGMPRWALALLLVLRTAIGASIGALLGSVVAIAMMVSGNEPVELEFVLATALLGIIVASVATIPPAVAAANQDPVRVLRTP
jgi:putative ABC transport system permease protein